MIFVFVSSRGGHCIGDCTPTRNRGQSEVKRSRRSFEAGQAVKLGIGGSFRTVKVSPGDRWAWLMLDSQGSRPDFWCGQGVKHQNLLGQDLDCGRGWKYRRLCNVPPSSHGEPSFLIYKLEVWRGRVWHWIFFSLGFQQTFSSKTAAKALDCVLGFV